jgi:hypothetical protein
MESSLTESGLREKDYQDIVNLQVICESSGH